MEPVIELDSEVLCGMAVSYYEKEIPLDTDIGKYVVKERYLSFGKFVAEGPHAANRVLLFFRHMFVPEIKPMLRYMVQRRFISNFFIEDVGNDVAVAVLYPIHAKASGKVSGLGNVVFIPANLIEAIGCIEAVEERGRIKVSKRRVVYVEEAPLHYIVNTVEKYIGEYFEMFLYTPEKV